MGHSNLDSLTALRDWARALRDESAGAMPPSVSGLVHDEGPRREAAAGMGAPHSIAVVLAFAFLLLVGGVGTAIAADAAAPGDLLYPVDLFVERAAGVLGFPADHTNERLDEARRLLDRGRTADAVSMLRAGLRDAGATEDAWTIPAMAALEESAPLDRGAASDPAFEEALAALIETARAAHGGELDQPGLAVSRAAHELVEVARSHASDVTDAAVPPRTGTPPEWARPGGVAPDANPTDDEPRSGDTPGAGHGNAPVDPPSSRTPSPPAVGHDTPGAGHGNAPVDPPPRRIPSPPAVGHGSDS